MNTLRKDIQGYNESLEKISPMKVASSRELFPQMANEGNKSEETQNTSRILKISNIENFDALIEKLQSFGKILFCEPHYLNKE